VLEFDGTGMDGARPDELRYAWEQAIRPGIEYLIDHS
jgi:hypothetical protein